MEYIQDIVIAILLVLGLISGLFTGAFKKLTRIVVFLGLFFGLYFGLKDFLVDYLRFGVLMDATKGAGLTLELQPDFVVTVTTLEDLFVVLQNVDADLTAVLLKTTCQVACTVVVFLAFLLVADILSFPIGFVLYHLLFKFIFLQAGRKPKFISRTFGGVLGLVQVMVFVYFYGVAAGQLGEVSGSVMNLLIEAGEQTGADLSTYVTYLEYAYKGLSNENSIILGGIMNALVGAGFDPYMFVSVAINGENYTLPRCIDEIIENAKDSIINLIGGSAQQSQPDSNAVKEAANLYNLSFNF